MRGIGIDHLRKEAEDEDNDTIANTEAVQENAPDTGNVKGPPDELVGVPGRIGHLVGVADGAPDAVPEEEALGEDVGGVEAADADGEDVVERRCRTDVDEADGAGNARHDHDCVQRDGGVVLDLVVLRHQFLI